MRQLTQTTFAEAFQEVASRAQTRKDFHKSGNLRCSPSSSSLGGALSKDMITRWLAGWRAQNWQWVWAGGEQ